MTDTEMVQRIAELLRATMRGADAADYTPTERDQAAYDAIVDLYRQERRELVWDTGAERGCRPAMGPFDNA